MKLLIIVLTILGFVMVSNTQAKVELRNECLDSKKVSQWHECK